MGDVVGYARVSTEDQTAQAQEDALIAAGAVRVFTETASGAKRDRPQLLAALDYCREGDVLVVQRLDRLGRTMRHILELMETLAERGIGFRSLSQEIDTTSPGGRMVFHIAAAFAEFERDLIRERTREGLAAARAQGRVGGRPSKLTKKQIEEAHRMRERGRTLQHIADVLNVGRSTVSRALQGPRS